MSYLKKMMVKMIACLAVFVNGGCCARQEQFKYFIVQKEYQTFALTARLDGTYYKERCGDVDKPYTLFISISPSIKGNFSLRNVSLSFEEEKPVFETDSPEMKTDIGVDSNRFYFIKIPDLDIEYKDYRIKFEIWKDGEFYKVLDVLFEKDFSSRLTHPWLEKVNSA
jgi:hypothetical protein